MLHIFRGDKKCMPKCQQKFYGILDGWTTNRPEHRVDIRVATDFNRHVQ